MNKNEIEHYRNEDISPLYIRATISPLVPFIQPGLTLNLGVGYGVWDDWLATQDHLKCESLDINPELIQSFKSKHSKLKYILTDVFDFCPTKPYVNIIASHFLEHMEEPIKLLSLMRTWLAPQGRIFIVVPNAQSYHRLIGHRMGLLNSPESLNEGDRLIGHKRVYDKSMLKVHLEAADLEIQKIGSVTLKTNSNEQLKSYPRSYVDACIGFCDELGDFGSQLYCVAAK
jgi:2-polyprenyl-3-methyl-5-hydroxy-6-metoxy-1,4-benzoquinol methylase